MVDSDISEIKKTFHQSQDISDMDFSIKKTEIIHGSRNKKYIFFSMLTYFLTLITAMPWGIPAVKFRQECFYSSSGKLHDLFLIYYCYPSL